ncbi:MAG: phytanoyl-CoA dioxygenase family protein [Planctomycetota bacterium]|nr:phytanoyl-CoA dioxygenase family protein [Planctomycetota bacterium]
MDLAELGRRYHEDGFAVARGVFSLAEIAAVIAELDSYIAEHAATLPPADIHFEAGPGKAIKSMFRLHERRPFFDRLQNDPRIMAMMRAIFPGGDVVADGVIYFGKPAREGSVTPVHQDNAFQCWKPPLELTATIALDESTPENGALTIARGSHRLGLLPHKLSGVAGFSRCLVEPIDPGKFPDVMTCLKPGDMVFHSVDAVHGSNANRTDRPRRQMGVSYHSTLAARDEAERERYLQSLKTIYPGSKAS